MKEIFKSFRAFCEAGALFVALGGRLYTDEAPAGTSMPYAVWTFPSISTGYDLENKANETISPQLNIYSKTETEILDLFDKADNDFNSGSFVVSGYQLVKFQRVFARKIKEDGVKRFIIDYSAEIGEV